MRTKLFLFCGVIAGPLFSIFWFILGATRANYNPIKHPISSLAIGNFGWTQQINFIILGLLLLTFAIGLIRLLRANNTSIWGPLFIVVIAIGFLGAGVFVADPLNGYPPGTPVKGPVPRSIHGVLHDLFSAFFFFGLPTACFIFARYFRKWQQLKWRIYSVVTGISFLVMFVFTSIGFAQETNLATIAGLLQRITVTNGLTWLTLLGIYLLKAPSEILKNE